MDRPARKSINHDDGASLTTADTAELLQLVLKHRTTAGPWGSERGIAVNMCLHQRMWKNIYML